MTTQEILIDDSLDSAQPAAIPYRSLSAMAVLSIVFGVLSILVVFHWVFWVIPAIAIALAMRALKQIEYAPTEYTGKIFARIGIGLAIALWLTGVYIHHYIQLHSIPSGYKAITFDYLQPNLEKQGEIIPPSAFDLEPNENDPDKRIFISGYIYPGKRSINIKDFILVPTQNHCNFCAPQIRSTDMMRVKFTGDLSVDYTNRPIKVGGKMHIDREQVTNPFGGVPYQLDADYLQE